MHLMVVFLLIFYIKLYLENYFRLLYNVYNMEVAYIKKNNNNKKNKKIIIILFFYLPLINF